MATSSSSSSSLAEGSVQCEFTNVYHCKLSAFTGHTHPYGCYVKSQNLPPNFRITAFNGKRIISPFHMIDNQLIAVRFQDSNIPKIPRGIGLAFENLYCLDVSSCGLMEIDKFDLQEMTRLGHLDASNNCLEIIHGDLFEFNKKLRNVSFVNNKIKSIGAELIDGFRFFKEIDFRGNSKIDLKLDCSCEDFDTFRQSFTRACMQINEKVENDEKEKLKEEVQKLKDENRNLKDEIT
jgi:hypothetical protein